MLHLTGLLRWPECHKALIDTRATGRSKTAPATAPATPSASTPTAWKVVDALADFYRSERDVINKAISNANQQQAHAEADHQAALEAVTAELPRQTPQ